MPEFQRLVEPDLAGNAGICLAVIGRVLAVHYGDIGSELVAQDGDAVGFDHRIDRYVSFGCKLKIHWPCQVSTAGNKRHQQYKKYSVTSNTHEAISSVQPAISLV